LLLRITAGRSVWSVVPDIARKCPEMPDFWGHFSSIARMIVSFDLAGPMSGMSENVRTFAPFFGHFFGFSGSTIDQ
jgi:hypothetical protein